MRFLRSSSTGMNATSTAPDSSASVACPEFGNSTGSTGRLSFLPSASARSAVTPRGLPSASLTTKKTDIDGANTSATRSFPVAPSSFMALSLADAPPATSSVSSSPHVFRMVMGSPQPTRLVARVSAASIEGSGAVSPEMRKAASVPKGGRASGRRAMKIVESAVAYEAWLRAQLGSEVVEKDIATKHAKMAQGPFPFLRATYWRWAETILEVCPELADAPQVLAVGDIHLENYGTWRDDDGRLIWGVNDFDEAADMPYALDLVRLGTSAAVGCPHLDTIADISANILRGYADGLADPHPIILDHDYAQLRKLVNVPNRERAHFWAKIAALKATKAPPPERYAQALARAMPDQGLSIRYSRRTAGAGRLGRPRFVGVADWRGAPIVREAKAALPSAWTRVKGRGAQTLRCYEIATGKYRAPDPWYALTDDIVVRRLSPNNRKLDAETHPLELIDKRMLRLMARDLASIHLGLVDAGKAIERDMRQRGASWLTGAVKRAAALVREEQRKWTKAARAAA